MTQKVCKSQSSVGLLAFGDLVWLSNTFEKCENDFFEDIVVFHLSLYYKGNRSEVVVSLTLSVRDSAILSYAICRSVPGLGFE